MFLEVGAEKEGPRNLLYLSLDIHDSSTPKPVVNVKNRSNIGVVWSGRLDIQLVPISIALFGLPGHTCCGSKYVCEGGILRVLGSLRTLEKAGMGVIGSGRICVAWSVRE
ncbi:hypothetical protein AVEN_269818-1 [Araneus ventricosus]|uniref:Uncharacterized protein n=1 Tax=Araneus ventricosus TaxID=182803 RepID=A0A4Y2MPP6_ARAVE|nr:hypothetical protein AVEN_199195-1 [Araneus ventricosus]GBN48458.1 hypothetical protein AVEN_27037-1 [Araneus ventricosus]GBN48482.1 hypothetical protein AVEN_269818-1 [Araneus ventricosus]